MDRKKFFDVVRAKYGPLNQKQVEGFDLILDEAVRRRTRWDNLSYILATVWHETAFTMQPIKEKGGEKYLRAKKYWPFFGRGYVQLTWEDNYKHASDFFGVDFVKDPDKVMETKYAIPILFTGMEKGWFTGKSLDDYLDGVDEDDKEDLREFSNARRIVNGTDKQVEIGQHALTFELALKTADYSNAMPLESPEKPADGPKPVRPIGGLIGFIAALVALAIALFFGGAE